MTDQLEILSKKENLDVENLKFVIRLRFGKTSSLTDENTCKKETTIDAFKGRRNTFDQSVITFEQENVKDNVGSENTKIVEDGRINSVQGELLLRASTLPAAFENQSNEISPYNSALIVNPLHLAIIARQKTSVQWIISHALKDKKRFNGSSKCFRSLLGDKIFLSNANKFSQRDQMLNGMNAFHLSSQYFSEALTVIFETLDTYDISLGNVLKYVRDNGNIFKHTPLHVAARKSSVRAAR